MSIHLSSIDFFMFSHILNSYFMINVEYMVKMISFSKKRAIFLMSNFAFSSILICRKCDFKEVYEVKFSDLRSPSWRKMSFWVTILALCYKNDCLGYF